MSTAIEASPPPCKRPVALEDHREQAVAGLHGPGVSVHGLHVVVKGVVVEGAVLFEDGDRVGGDR